MSFAGRLAALICAPAYGLRRSRIAGLPAFGSVLFLCFLVAAWSAFRVWQGGFTELQALALAASVLVAVLLLGADAQHYLIFRAKPCVLPEDTPDLVAEEKLRLWGSGLFAVSDLARYLVEVPVFLWCTRLDEFVVAAQVRPRNILDAGVPASERGWWYIFLEPSRVLDVVPGEVGFGLRVRPAVRVFRQTDKGRESFCLSCEDTRQLAILLKTLQAKREGAQARI